LGGFFDGLVSFSIKEISSDFTENCFYRRNFCYFFTKLLL
jgi:hypothetical protein